MSKPIFLDWASTSPIVKYPCSNYGPFMNVNANYAYKEKKLLKECEDRVKKAIGAKGGKVVFGGTSSQLIENLVNAMRDKNNLYVICSAYEHDSVYRYAHMSIKKINRLDEKLRGVESRGCNFMPTVFWQGVQNITGEIFPKTEVGQLCHKHGAFYICDATAMIGHTNIPANIDNWCSAFVMDGHKLGTELGIGCCWVSDRLDKWLNGFKLHGTPNLAGALALTQAVEDACDIVNIEHHNKHWVDLYKSLCDMLDDNNIVCYNVDIADAEDFTYAINAIRLPGFNADALQQYLASKQIYVSIGGSACAEKHDYRVLNAYGLSNDEASEVIRVSFGEDSSVEDVKALVEGIVAFRKEYL